MAETQIYLEVGLEDIPIDDGVVGGFPQSFSSKDVFLRQRSFIIHNLVMSLGFSTRTASLGQPWKISINPWSGKKKI